MSSIALSHPSQVGVRAYVANVAQAARSLGSALFSFTPARLAIEPARRHKAASIYSLYRMAKRYETLSPSLAAELRHIAARQD